MRIISLVGLFMLGLAAVVQAVFAGGGSSSGGFDDFCTGRLLKEVAMEEPRAGTFWRDTGETAAVGTEFLIGRGANWWVGYIIRSEGSIQKLEGVFGEGLVQDEHFESSCVEEVGPGHFLINRDEASRVLLKDTVFYDNEDHSGDGCSIAAGTQLSGFNKMASRGSSSWLVASDLESLCGFDRGYTSQLLVAKLVFR